MPAIHRLPVVSPSLLLTRVIGITHVISKRFHRSNFLACPFGCVLGEVLDVVHGIVPFVFGAVFEAIPALFDVVGDCFCLANLGLLVLVLSYSGWWQ